MGGRGDVTVRVIFFNLHIMKNFNWPHTKPLLKGQDILHQTWWWPYLHGDGCTMQTSSYNLLTTQVTKNGGEYLCHAC